MRFTSFLLLALAAVATGCSSAPKARETKVFAAGEKAVADHLTYSIVDTEIHTRLGEDPTPRIPQNRFFLVQISVSNSSNEEVAIPSLTLVDDAGKTYNELSDGSGVSHWLGVVRRVRPGLTETGYVAFDAPAVHYKLRLSDETSDSDVYADIPLSFVHEQGGSDAPAAATEEPLNMTAPAKKK